MKMLDGKITPRLCLSDSPQDGQDPGCLVSSYWAPLCPMLGRSGVPPLCPPVCRQVRSSVPGCPIVCRQVAAQGAVARCTALTSHSHTGRLCHLVQVERRRRKVEKEAIWESKPPVDKPMQLLASSKEWVVLRICFTKLRNA